MIALDTTILIWGVRREEPEGREDLVARCTDLIADYKQRCIAITVPSVVMAEYLADSSPEKQKEQQAIIGSNFHVSPFDAKAAAIAAELHSKRLMNEIRAESDIPRQCLKADVQIIATAIAHDATHIYSDDGHFTKLAQGKILVLGVPKVRASQTEMFTQDESDT